MILAENGLLQQLQGEGLAHTPNLQPMLYSLGESYLRMIGQKPEEIMPRLGDYAFWDAQYLNPNGDAWGMEAMDAFRCLVDFRRTTPLLQGITDTVRGLKRSGIEHPIAIDAGTGTGILSVGLAMAGCDKVFALEINPNSARAATQFIDELGLSNQIEVIQCDATQVDLQSLKANVLVSENLSGGLFDEPQYHIIHHLSKHLVPDAPIIPYAAELSVALGTASWNGIVKKHSDFRNLKDTKQLTNLHPYFNVISTPQLDLREVGGAVKIDVSGLTEPANSLIISTRFQINGRSNPHWLEPDAAEFLGKTIAFKLNEEIVPGQEPMEISLSYPVGMPRGKSVITISDNVLTLTGPNHK